jgi:hypothetical protein
MKTKTLVIALGSIALLGIVALIGSQRHKLLFLLDPPGSRVVLVQYVNESGQQKSRFAGSFASFDDCEQAREHLPKGGGFVLGGVCVRETQWKALNQ